MVKCSICNNSIKGGIGSISNLDGVVIIKCKNCSKNTVSFSKLPEVMVVPVTLENMELITIKKQYYHSMSYKRKGATYLAFYVKSPISAITHYAKVKHILIDVDIKKLSFISKVKTNMDSEKYKVYELENIIKLDKNIKRKISNAGIQNIKNTTLNRLLTAKFIEDL